MINCKIEVFLKFRIQETFISLKVYIFLIKEQETNTYQIPVAFFFIS